MAIKRVNPSAITKVISITDDAVDRENSDIEAYATSLDLKFLKLKEGISPTYFLIKHLAVLQQIEIKDAHYKLTPPSKDLEGKKVAASMSINHQSEMLCKYFEACVKFIEEDGKEIPVGINEFNSTVVQEVGSYCMLSTQIGDQLKKT